jgi:hypothetical protein
VKDSVFSDNNISAVSVGAGVVTGNSFTRNGTALISGSMYSYPPAGSSVTIANNSFSQNNIGIQTSGPASIQNNMIEGGYNALSVAHLRTQFDQTVLAVEQPSGRRRPPECPGAPRAQPQGVDVSRKKRVAFSHMSFCVAGSPSGFRQATTASA